MSKQMTSAMVSPSGGLASNVSDYLRPQTKAKVLNNIRQLKRGIFSSGYSGWVRQRAGAFNSGAAFLEFATFTDNTAVDTLLFQVGAKLYSYNFGTNTETQITGGSTLSATAIPCMRMYQPGDAAAYMVYCSSGVEPQKITSTSAMAVLDINSASPFATASPLPVKTYSKPTICEPFYDRMIYTGFSASNSTTSRDVVITNSGTADTVTQSTPIVATDGGVFTLPPQIGLPVGVKTLRLSNESSDQVVLIGCTHGFALIVDNSATNDATSFQMILMTDEFGLLSNRAMVVVQNDIFMLATDGIRRFSGIANGNTLLAASMTRELNDIILMIQNSEAVQAFACHNRATQEIEFWFPAGGGVTQNQTALVLNYNTDSTSYEAIEPIWYSRTGTSVGAMTYFNQVQYGGGYNGLLQIHNVPSPLYDTIPVPFEITCAFISPGDAIMAMEIDQCMALTEGGSQSFLVNAYGYEDMGGASALRRNPEYANFPLQALQPPPTILGQWVLGVSGFPSDYIKLLDLRPPGHMRFLELQILGNLSSHNVDFIGWEYRCSPQEARP